MSWSVAGSAGWRSPDDWPSSTHRYRWRLSRLIASATTRAGRSSGFAIDHAHDIRAKGFSRRHRRRQEKDRAQPGRRSLARATRRAVRDRLRLAHGGKDPRGGDRQGRGHARLVRQVARRRERGLHDARRRGAEGTIRNRLLPQRAARAAHCVGPAGRSRAGAGTDASRERDPLRADPDRRGRVRAPASARVGPRIGDRSDPRARRQRVWSRVRVLRQEPHTAHHLGEHDPAPDRRRGRASRRARELRDHPGSSGRYHDPPTPRPSDPRTQCVLIQQAVHRHRSTTGQGGRGAAQSVREPVPDVARRGVRVTAGEGR